MGAIAALFRTGGSRAAGESWLQTESRPRGVEARVPGPRVNVTFPAACEVGPAVGVLVCDGAAGFASLWGLTYRWGSGSRPPLAGEPGRETG
jgi:hypothetical protein